MYKVARPGPRQSVSELKHCCADALPPSNLEQPFHPTPPSSSDGRQSPQPTSTAPSHNGSHHHPQTKLPSSNGSVHSQEQASRGAPARVVSPAPPPAPPAASKGRTLIPTDIPKMGGARPKQTGSVGFSALPSSILLENGLQESSSIND